MSWIRRIASVVVRAKLRVCEVAALVVVIADTESLQLGEIDVKRAATIVHVLAIQCLKRTHFQAANRTLKVVLHE